MEDGAERRSNTGNIVKYINIVSIVKKRPQNDRRRHRRRKTRKEDKRKEEGTTENGNAWKTYRDREDIGGARMKEAGGTG